MLELRKKGNKHWLLIDEEIGEFTPSKFTINRLNNVINIVYFNNLKSKEYNVSDCYIFDIYDTSGFNTSDGVAFMDKLEELNCPCFQKNENIFNITGGAWGDITGNLSNQTDLRTALDSKLDKVSTSGVERAYIINTDGTQGVKATSNFKDILEFANLASFPVTGESGKIYLALDTNLTYRWSGSAYVQIGGGGSTDFDIINFAIKKSSWNTFITKASYSGINYLSADNIISTGTVVPYILAPSGATIARNTVFRASVIQGVSGGIAEFKNNQILKSDFQIGILSMLVRFNPGANSTFRAFAGSSDTTAIGNINPSQYLSYMFGIGCDDTDTNYQLIYGENPSTRVKIDLGFSKNIVRVFSIIMYNNNSTGNTEVIIKSILDSLEFSTSVTYRLKGGYRVWANRGNTSTLTDVDASFSSIEMYVKNDE